MERAASPRELQPSGNGRARAGSIRPWILAPGIALRRWLFSLVSAIRIKALEVLDLGQQRPLR